MAELKARRVLSIDLGKTSCRARLDGGDGVLGTGRSSGAPGLSDERGVTAALEAIAAAVSPLGQQAHADLSLNGLTAAGVGAAGASTSPAGARTLAKALRERLRCPVVVASDAIAAHAGAFEGEPGTLLIAGTGSVAVTLTGSGEVRQVDGWGPWLGDAGSGQWIGRRGFDAALRAFDGRGAATGLQQLAETHIGGPLDGLPGWVGQASLAQRLGSFAPLVLDAAAEDEMARAIVEAAVAELVSSARAGGAATVCVVGGVSQHPLLADLLREALAAASLEQLVPRGTPLDGAALLAERHDTSYEQTVERNE